MKARRIVFIMALSACLLLCLGSLSFAADDASASDAPATAEGATQPVVKVGVVEYPEYCYQDSNGAWNGIDAEYIENIAQHAGFQAEFVVEDSASKMLADIDSGAIDIMSDVVKTDERAEKYLFSELEQGNSNLSVFVRKDDERWDYGNIEQFSQMTVGLERESASSARYEEWCSSHGVTPKITWYATTEDLLVALDAGDVDGILMGSDYYEGLRTVQVIAPQPYYFMFRQGNIALKNEVDSAMSEIVTQKPNYLQSLVEKYRNKDEQASLAFVLTKNEKDYITEHPTVTIAVLNDDAPYFYQATDGTPKGILPDYYSNIASLTRLNFSFVTYRTQAEAITALRAGEVDVLGMYSDGLPNASQAGLRLTRAYTTVNTAMVTRAGIGVDAARRVAVKERSLDLFEQSFTADSGVELIGYSTATACFDALKRGEVDATICGLPSATWLINQTNSSAYSIFIRSSETLDLCGALAPSSGTLASLLDKSINAASGNVDGIIANDTLAQNDLQTSIARVPPLWMAAVVLVLVLLIIGLAFVLTVVVRRQREKAAVLAAKAAADNLAAEAAAEKAINDERTRFFSTVSHDMRTPLNGIMGFADMAARTDDVECKDDCIDKIKVSSTMLLSLVNDVLTISRMESGKHPLSQETTPLPAFFEETLVPMRENAEMKGIALDYDASAFPVCSVLLDRLATQKILLNLLANAVKFTPAGGHVLFTVKGENESPEVVRATLTVADDGIGMSDEFAQQAFAPFAQENAGAAGTAGAGTGLGLAIVKQLVDLMGASIELHTVKGEGTTFVVKMAFPVASADQAALSEGEEKEVLSQAPDIPLEGRHALLVEDNLMNAEIARAMLVRHGLIVDYATDGEEGVSTFEKSRSGYFDFILMDIRMPKMDGYEATRTIRLLDRPDATKVPIIAMTADAYPEDIERCLRAGMNAHVSKPVNEAVLFRAVNETLS